MKWALVDDAGIVINVIEYNGTSLYTPPAGVSLQQVDESINIGDHIDNSQSR